MDSKTLLWRWKHFCGDRDTYLELKHIFKDCETAEVESWALFLMLSRETLSCRRIIKICRWKLSLLCSSFAVFCCIVLNNIDAHRFFSTKIKIPGYFFQNVFPLWACCGLLPVENT